MQSQVIDRTKLFRRAPNMLQSEIDGDIIALSVDKGMCYGLNSVGSQIWRALNDWNSIESICAALAQEFEVDRATCEEEVVRLLGELHAEGLLEIQ